jgi:glycosyltransferase involved in cell wall biosynthesis
MVNPEVEASTPDAPKVSVVMATYNRSGVLPYSIGSVLRQSFTDFELLVVGDGCTDDSAAVVAAMGDRRIRWIGLERNSGHQSEPNNAGLEAARGEIIAYLGHDDLWLPDHLADLVAAIAAGADMAHAAIYWPPAPGETARISALNPYRPGSSIPPSAVAHRRAIVARSGGWRHFRQTVGWPETDLWARFHACGCAIVAVPKLSVIKISGGSRRNVYKDRPSHEQAQWFERIGEESDLATKLPMEVIAATVRPSEMRYVELIRQFVAQTRDRLARRLKGGYKMGGPGEAVSRLRRFKGLSEVPPECGPGLSLGGDK